MDGSLCTTNTEISSNLTVFWEGKDAKRVKFLPSQTSTDNWSLTSLENGVALGLCE